MIRVGRTFLIMQPQWLQIWLAMRIYLLFLSKKIMMAAWGYASDRGKITKIWWETVIERLKELLNYKIVLYTAKLRYSRRASFIVAPLIIISMAFLSMSIRISQTL